MLHRFFSFALCGGLALMLGEASGQTMSHQALAALAAFVQKDAEGFVSRERSWSFRFPEDHGAHPDHRVELWRFSGSLATGEGRQLGFQLTFLRAGLVAAHVAVGPSAWAAREAYWAELVLGDGAERRDYRRDRLARAAKGHSGAGRSPVRIWVDNWSANVPAAQRFRLQATDGDLGIELDLEAQKDPVSRSANGVHGYIVSRLRAQGRVTIDGVVFEAQGSASLEHGWGAVPLPVGPVVWDRFLLHLEDGRDLLAARLRRRDGSGAPVISGMLVERDGTARVLDDAALQIEPAGAGWRILLQETPLYVEPFLARSGPARVRGATQGQAYVDFAL